jgi:putative transposase
MDSYRSLTYHIVFATHRRARSIPDGSSKVLYNYLWGFLKKNRCHLYRINGIEDHIHIVCEIHPSLAISDVMRRMKASSSKWMKDSGLFPEFQGWSAGYGVFSYSKSDRPRIVNYVTNQKTHHRKSCFRQELIKILNDQGVAYDERFLP